VPRQGSSGFSSWLKRHFETVRSRRLQGAINSSPGRRTADSEGRESLRSASSAAPREQRLWRNVAAGAREDQRALDRGEQEKCLAPGRSHREAGVEESLLDLLEPNQQKTPRRGGGAFLGLLQGGEICISIYVDPWEVGGPFRAAGRHRWESMGAIWATPDPTRKSCRSSSSRADP
jgi:hypothetical protein